MSKLPFATLLLVVLAGSSVNAQLSEMVLKAVDFAGGIVAAGPNTIGIANGEEVPFNPADENYVVCVQQECLPARDAVLPPSAGNGVTFPSLPAAASVSLWRNGSPTSGGTLVDFMVYGSCTNVAFLGEAIDAGFWQPGFVPRTAAVDTAGGYLCDVLSFVTDTLPLDRTGIWQEGPTGVPVPFQADENCAGTMSGDPHIVGFLGQRFNVLGENGHVYNMVSTPHLSYSARFNATKYITHGRHATLVAEIGVLVGAYNRVRVLFADAQSTQLTVEVNGARIMADDHEPVPLSEDGSEFVMRVGQDGRRVLIATREMYFDINGKLRQFRHLDDGVKVVDWSSREHFHGLLGQTARAGRESKVGSAEVVVDAEWPSWLDGSLSDYESPSGDVFGTEFTFNMFDGSA